MTASDLPTRIRNRRDLETLLARATNYEETRPRVKERPSFRLDRVRGMLDFLDRPQVGPRTVHIAGSKGKGSVARMVDAVLRSCPGDGPVGLFTSPHLEDLAERIQIDGRSASDEELSVAGERLLPWVRRTRGTPDAPSFFEVLTGMAWTIFRARGCSAVILETGLGGRLDATNVCRPEAIVITNVEREHVEILGPTIEAIASEKAGILKENVPAATAARGSALAVIVDRAARLGAPLEVVGRDIHVLEAVTEPGPRTTVRLRRPVDDAPLTLVLPVAGVHHAANVALAAWIASRLGTADEILRGAIAGLTLPGVVEPLGGDPLVVVDGAHTAASAAATRSAVSMCWPGRPCILLLAMLEGKETDAVLDALVPGAKAVVTTELPTPRRMRAEDLAARVSAATNAPVDAVEDPGEALEAARRRAAPGDLVLATGSIRLAGAVRGRLRAR